jgi:ribosomal protein L7/L12
VSDDWVRAQLDGLRSRVAELEARVADLDGKASSAAAAESALDPDIVELIRSGRTIQAIQLHRERTGLGLAEAKEAVERMAASI